MAQISAEQVRQLRSKTGAGMMDCKAALTETGGDLDAAVDWLRKKGLAAAAKKSGRVAADGLIGVSVDGTAGAVVEVNSETDFVARNEVFQQFVARIAELARATGGDLEALRRAQYPDTGRALEEELTQQIATIGENLALRRAAALSVKQGLIGSYVHAGVADGLGKIGVLVALESEAPDDVLAPLAKHLAMHVAAASPQSLSPETLDPNIIEREKQVLSEQARDSGKPEAIIEKMIEGRMRKFYEEVALLKQISVVDGETRIEDVVAEASKSAGTPIALTGFVRFALGEGIEESGSDA